MELICTIKPEPLVSIVTPFHNTRKYLAECIESVLRQTYGNWEYILVDNCSNDGSSEIAAHYAAKCNKIRLVDTKCFLSQTQNYNFALSLIAPNSQYCKIVQADDWIYPECVGCMVAVAETDRSVGIVSSYRLKGNRLLGEGIPSTSSVLTGHEVCHLHLTGALFVFGTPTTVLYRSEIVRTTSPFYDERSFFDDSDVCYRILKSWNFGFVHQVLSFCRVDDDSIRGRVVNFGPDVLERFVHVAKFGPLYLEGAEFSQILREAKSAYYRFLARGAVRREDGKFWEFHKAGLASAGLRLEKMYLAKLLCFGLARLAANPGITCSRIYHRLRSVPSAVVTHKSTEQSRSPEIE
ncbi:MAG TPA: glycosyltransferase [Terracidiphilus sp.]|nr:glycosyltransferase [Terracidiphilus sp.]